MEVNGCLLPAVYLDAQFPTPASTFATKTNNPPTIGEMGSGIVQFVKAFGYSWGVRVTGALSAPFAVAGFFFEGSARVITVLLGISCFIIASYFVWKKERDRADVLEERIRPKLKCSFSMTEAACVARGVTIQYIRSERSFLPSGVSITAGAVPFMLSDVVARADYFRLRVDADKSVLVEKCQGRMLSIEREGEFLLGEPIMLPFAPGESEDALAKTIHEHVPEYLDVLVITEKNEVTLATPKLQHPSSASYQGIFSKPAKYHLRLAVTSSGPTIECELLFNWTGSRTTAELFCEATRSMPVS